MVDEKRRRERERERERALWEKRRRGENKNTGSRDNSPLSSGQKVASKVHLLQEDVYACMCACILPIDAEPLLAASRFSVERGLAL